MPSSLTLTSPCATSKPDTRPDTASSPYASVEQSQALLQKGAQFRRDRIAAADMLTTDEAAQLVGTSRVTINAWIKNGRCIGISHLLRGYKLPRWQFEPQLWPILPPLAQALDSHDGWTVLSFLETPLMALDGQTPRAALEQGIPAERILALATAEAH